jgi:hypothetical protein
LRRRFLSWLSVAVLGHEVQHRQVESFHYLLNRAARKAVDQRPATVALRNRQRRVVVIMRRTFGFVAVAVFSWMEASHFKGGDDSFDGGSHNAIPVEGQSFIENRRTYTMTGKLWI